MTINLFLLWLPMILLAFANASFREVVLIKHFKELRAHQLSTLTLILFVSVYVWFIFPFLEVDSGLKAFLTGFIWVILTILFEFTLGRILKRSWANLFQQYNILSGRIWLVFVLCLLCLPYWVYTIRM